MRNNCGNIDNIPQKSIYTADVSDGYVQTEAGFYFKCQGNELSYGNGNTAYFIICNPCNSNVDIYINNTYYANYANVPLKLQLYLGIGAIREDLFEISKVVNTNTNFYRCKNNKARVFTGTNLENFDADKLVTIVIGQVPTYIGQVKGNVIIAPGNYYMAAVTPVNDTQQGTVQVTAAWWEKSRKCSNKY